MYKMKLVVICDKQARTNIYLYIRNKNVISSCQECKSCKDAIHEVFEMAKHVLAGFDPITMNDVEMCKIVTVSGIKTVRTTGRPCIRDKGNGYFEQKIQIEFDKLHLNCTLKSLDAMAKTVGVRLLPIPKIKLPSVGRRKKLKKANSIFLDWAAINLHLKMKLNFDKDEYDVLKSDIKNVRLESLKIYCEGEGLIMKSFEILTKSKVIRNLLGLIAQNSVKKAINSMFKAPQLKKMITMLNCGEPDPPEK